MSRHKQECKTPSKASKRCSECRMRYTKNIAGVCTKCLNSPFLNMFKKVSK